jgi:hypothetical protein
MTVPTRDSTIQRQCNTGGYKRSAIPLEPREENIITIYIDIYIDRNTGR